MGAGAVAWVIGVVLLGGYALLLPALRVRRRNAAPRLAAERRGRRPSADPGGRPPEPAADDRRPSERVTAERHEIVVDDDGLTVRVRGYAYTNGWTPRCAVRWDEVVSLALDTGAYDSIVSLYATTTTDHFRKHLLDAGAFSRAQWTALHEMVAARTGDRIGVDLSMLDEDRP